MRAKHLMTQGGTGT